MLKPTFTCSREKVVPVFVKGHSHDTVCEIKSFLDTVSMMYVNVDIQDSGVVSVAHKEKEYQANRESDEKHSKYRFSTMFLLEQFQYADDNVIDITKPRGL